MKRIIFFTSSYKIGLTGQLTEQALSFAKNYRNQFLFVSGEKEQFPGLFNKLDKNNVNYTRIHGIDDHSEFPRLVKEFNYCVDQFRPEFYHRPDKLAIGNCSGDKISVSEKIPHCLCNQWLSSQLQISLSYC